MKVYSEQMHTFSSCVLYDSAYVIILELGPY
jgi:hypothetical protein